MKKKSTFRSAAFGPVSRRKSYESSWSRFMVNMSNSIGSEQHSIGEGLEDAVRLSKYHWDYFEYFSDGPDGAKIVSCNACGHKFKTSSRWGTSNLIRHIAKCYGLDEPRPPKLPAEEPVTLQQGGAEITVDSDDQPQSQLADLKRGFASHPDHHDEPSSQHNVTDPGPSPNRHDETPSKPTGPAPDQYDEPPSQLTVTSPSPTSIPQHHDESSNQPTVSGPGPDHHDEPPSQSIVTGHDEPLSQPTSPAPCPVHYDEPSSQLIVIGLGPDPSLDHHDEPLSQPAVTNPGLGPSPDHDDEPPSQPTGPSSGPAPAPAPDQHDEPLSQPTFTSPTPGLNHHDEPLSQPTITGLGPAPSPDHHDDPLSQPTVIGHDEPPSQLTGPAPAPAPGPDHYVEPPSQPIATGLGPDPGPDHHEELVGTTTDYQQDWPFIKRSPLWATIASLEIYQTSLQRPHFSPLKKFKADRREGLAIAHVVTFWNMVKTLSDLQLTDPVDQINNSLEILTDLETHGFDVGAIRGRLNKFLSLKPKASQQTNELKRFEEELEKCNGEKRVEEEEINELEMKMKELREKLQQKATMKKVRDEEMMALQANMKLVSEQIGDCELAFKELAATPL